MFVNFMVISVQKCLGYIIGLQLGQKTTGQKTTGQIPPDLIFELESHFNVTQVIFDTDSDNNDNCLRSIFSRFWAIY